MFDPEWIGAQNQMEYLFALADALAYKFGYRDDDPASALARYSADARHRHRRLEISKPAGRVQRRAACARHRLDGARAEPEQRQQPVLHLLRRRPLPRQQYTVWGKVIEGMENVDKIKRGEPVKNPDKIVKA